MTRVISRPHPRFWLLAILAGLSVYTGPITAEVTEVSPGTVIRWPGEGVERCGMGNRSWEPIGGECWYAIDLLSAEGAIEVMRWRQGQRDRVTLRVGAYPYEVQHITLEDDSRVDLSPENLRRVQKENEQIAALWGLESPRRFDLPLAAPLASLPAGGRFGARRFFNGQPRNPHTGADYSADAGTPVLAVGADGSILRPVLPAEARRSSPAIDRLLFGRAHVVCAV